MTGLTIEQQEAIALAYVHAVGEGGMQDKSVYADDLTFWSPLSGDSTRADYLARAPTVKAIFTEPLTMTVDSLTSQPGRTVVQCHGAGVLCNGSAYSNTYIFMVEFNDKGQISNLREYADTARAREILFPAVQQWMASQPAEG